jgi:hypothetical protein
LSLKPQNPLKSLKHPLDKILDDIPGGSTDSIPCPIGESVGIYFGAWDYSKKFFLIPIWLPLLWGIGALIVENMSETLLRK